GSIGIACAPDHGDDYETLLRHADAAMYDAKEAGRGTYAVHAMQTASVRRHRLELESGLHTAIERDELHVLYQPQIELATGRLVAVEALVRWDHPELGRVMPDRFIPLAEESGLIADIDEWVRTTAFRQARQWADDGLEIRMAVNLSTRVLRDPSLAESIAELIERCGLPSHQ